MLSGSVSSSSGGMGYELGVHTDTGVVNSREFLEELFVYSLVVKSDESFLFSSKLEHLRFFSRGEVGISLGSVANFRYKDGHEGVVLVSHNT